MTDPPAPQNSPHLLKVTVEWDSDGRRARLGANGRRVLAAGATALIAVAGGLVIADSPSNTSSMQSDVLIPHNVKLACEHSVTPRVFVNVPARYAARAARGPKCH